MVVMNGYIYAIIAILCFLLSLILMRAFLEWNIGRCKSEASMKGKVVIVTGASSGVGYATAKDLAARGARVILACRNDERGIEAQNKIIEETGNTNVAYKNLNLSSLNSVRSFANEIIQTEDRLDVLINNAGILGHGNQLTVDGNVEGMQVNHFAPFLLTLLLLPLLKKSQPSRIVNVNSSSHYAGLFFTKKLNTKGYYGYMRTYANSKLCNMLFTLELARRLEGSGVVVNACHPGIVQTNLMGRRNSLGRFWFKILGWITARNIDDAAQSSLHLAVAEETATVTGKFFIDCKPRFISWIARNRNLAQRLWKFSESVVDYHGLDV